MTSSPSKFHFFHFVKGPDWLLLCVLVAAVGGMGGVFRFYPPPAPPVPFPKSSAEFRPAAERAAAVVSLQEQTTAHPDDMRAFTELAILHFEEGPASYVKALESLERARELGALDVRLFYYAGVLYEAQGLVDYAVTDFERYLRHRPTDDETRLRLGNLYYRLEEYEKAIDTYRALLARRSGDLMVSYNLALAYRENKNWTEALEALHPFLQSGRALPAGGRKALGDIYRGLSRWAQAMAEYEAEHKAGEDSLDLAAAMALTAEKMGNTDLAVDRWTRVLALDPQHRDARAHLRKLNRPVPRRRR